MKQKKEFKIIQALNLDNCETSIIKNKNKISLLRTCVSSNDHELCSLANRNTTATTNAILNFPVVTLKTGKKKK